MKKKMKKKRMKKQQLVCLAVYSILAAYVTFNYHI